MGDVCRARTAINPLATMGEILFGISSMESKKSIILIGGSSHVGKSTLAASLAQKLDWRQKSTDSLARHPGRPWGKNPNDVPAHVIEHYGNFDIDQLISSMLSHYEAMWKPLIEPIIVPQPIDAPVFGLVLEGSALLPQNVARGLTDRIYAVWLTASPDLIRDRIYAESGYLRIALTGRKLVDNFLGRTLAFNDFIRSEVDRLFLPHLEVGETVSADELPQRCLQMAGLTTLLP